MSSACPWVGSPPCISVSGTRIARCPSLFAGCGYGAEKGQEERFRKEIEAVVATLRTEGMAAFAEKYAYGPTRVQFENKDPRGFAQFKQSLAEHSAVGSA